MMMSEITKTELERTEDLFRFLRGEVPEGCKIQKRKMPKLTADQAWTVIWWLGNEYWQVPDFIERCGVCGDLFDSEREGACLDYGKAPYHFCDDCIHTNAFQKKLKQSPDNSERESYGMRDEDEDE